MKTCLARLVFREQCLGTVLAVHPNHFIVKNVPNHIGAQRFWSDINWLQCFYSNWYSVSASNFGPNWPITDRSGRFGPKLTYHGTFWSVVVQIDQSPTVLVRTGPNWPITGCFGQFGSKLANPGPFWSVRVQID